LSRIYVETSIPSFYYEVRTEAKMVARRHWTRQWWDASLSRDSHYSSIAVIDELDRGDFPGKEDALSMIQTMPMLEINDSIEEIIEVYLAHHVMPQDPTGDALHLALASYHQCDFLVTWNCQHLANANKFGHIRRVNGIIGLHVPLLVTPLELLGENS
jgi:hypothetical protein